MYGQQASIDPSLAALLQTAQMVTPDQTPTVAAQVAQAAAQKMQPQGIAQGMPQARQDFQAAMPSMMRNMQQAQMQQMVQQAMQPKPAGIEGLSSNIRMAEGGVVGYAGDTDGSLVGGPRRIDVSGDIPIYAPREGKESGETEAEYRARKAREAEEAQGERPIPRGLRWIQENILRPMSQMGGQRMAEMRGTPETPPAKPAPVAAVAPIPEGSDRRLNLPPGGIVSPGMAAAPAPQAPAPRPPAQRPPAPAQQAAPTGVAAALAQRPTYDTTGIAAAATPYIQAGEGDVGRIRKAEEKRTELEKTLPDLSAKGIAALQQRMQDVGTAEATRKENLGLDRVIQQLLGRAQGSGGAARADIQFMNAQRAAEDAFSQAKLGNQQAQLLLEKAQQERQLGREDRAIALEKEAANRMEKARDDALRAQQIAQSTEAAKYQGAVQMRGQDIQAQTAAADRAAQAALRNLPSIEQQMAERVMKDYMAKHPGSTLSDAWDFYRGSRASSAADKNLLAKQKLLADDPLYKLARMQESQEKDPAKKADALRRMQEIERRAGIIDAPGAASASTQIPSGVTVTRVGP